VALRLAALSLVVAVPVVALAALHGFGAVLDTSPRQPFERAGVALSTLAVPLLLVATAVRAPVAGEVPPRLGVTALVACLVVLCAQTALAGLASLVVAPRPALEGD
jgi:hypothetical protein